jgi:DNA-binding LacI/PurR family transcriptional regulator
MREIAEAAGVDHSTVSLALRNSARLRPETCHRIQDLAAKMGYRQNPKVAQLMAQLRAGKEGHFNSNLALLDFATGGIVIPKLTLQGIEERARELGYGIEYFKTSEYSAKRLEEILMSRGVQGLIVATLMKKNRLPDEFLKMWPRFAVCVCGIRPSNPALHFACNDHYFTAMDAVRQMVRDNFRRIGLVLQKGINIETEYRFFGGFASAHLEAGTTEHPAFLLMEDGDREGFLAWVEQASPDAIITSEPDTLAWLRAAGYSVPGDISLAHLDVETAGEAWAGMVQCRRMAGRAVVEVVVNLINNNSIGIPEVARPVLLESYWRPGSTCKRRNKNARPVRKKANA